MSNFPTPEQEREMLADAEMVENWAHDESASAMAVCRHVRSLLATVKLLSAERARLGKIMSTIYRLAEGESDLAAAIRQELFGYEDLDGKRELAEWDELVALRAVIAAQRERLKAKEGRVAKVSMMEEEVERLRSYECAYKEWSDKTEWVQKDFDANRLPVALLGKHRADVLREEVERLRAERDRLREGLRPFADDAAKLDPKWDDRRNRSTLTGIEFTVGDCRRAAALLKENTDA